MKRAIRLGPVPIIAVACLVAIGGYVKTAVADRSVSPGAQEGNLIRNPGFEGAYSAWNGIPELQVAAEWTPFWREDPDHNPAYFRPEYKRALASLFPNRVFSGESAQQWFTFHASHLAGMYQQVSGVTPGQNYRFSIWTQVWSSSEDDPFKSILPANPHLQIGIDPTGNWNAGAPTVIWSGEAPMSGVIDQWGLMSLEATAENSTITVFMHTNPDFPNKHNDMYWDNASLEATAPPTPTVAPTPTAGPPTSTPEATNTPLSTETATASSTSTATPSPVPPTETRTATPTATQTQTNTPEPTATATPTATPPEFIAGVEDVGLTSPASSTSTPSGNLAAQKQPEADQQPGDEPVSLDPMAILALLAIGVAILLLLVLIVILTRNMRQR